MENGLSATRCGTLAEVKNRNSAVRIMLRKGSSLPSDFLHHQSISDDKDTILVYHRWVGMSSKKSDFYPVGLFDPILCIIRGNYQHIKPNLPGNFIL